MNVIGEGEWIFHPVPGLRPIVFKFCESRTAHS